MSISERLNTFIEFNKYSINKFSELTGIPYRTLQNYLGGNRTPSGENLSIICTQTNIDCNWLLTGQGNMIKTDPSKCGEANEEFSFIPLYDVELAAGGGSLIESERITTKYAFRKEWVTRITSSPGSLALCVVKGESMTPTLHNGDIVMIDTSRKKLLPNGIYCINLGGYASVKRIEFGISGKARIISDNMAEYPPYEADIGDIIIIGQVVWYARELIHSCSCNYHI